MRERIGVVSDEAWAVIEPHLPKGRPGAHRVDDRRVISGILHVLRSGCMAPIWDSWATGEKRTSF